MTIRNRDRKLLWGRSGNRCAICRDPLAAGRTPLDRESVVGQEAHIVARSPSGPRGDDDRSVNIDSYENLILLCSRHHKIVDDQRASYSADWLRAEKSSHEAWVSDMLEGRPNVAPRPIDLPMLPERLVNRETELAVLVRVRQQAQTAARASVVVLTGMRGVGKSALGAHWVMNNWRHFNDQLVCDLSRRRQGKAIDISEVLANFLRDLGTPDDAVPARLESRRRLFLNVTASQRILMLLDDVEHATQVSALLPAGAGSMVVVTSNHYLEELLYDGATPLPLEPLDESTSRRLLIAIAGAERIDAEPAAVDELIAICNGLPIALNVCGARLVSRDRGLTIREVVDGVLQASNRLAAVSGVGDHAIDVIFDAAYSELPRELRLVYRRLGLHPGSDVAISTVAALVDRELDETAQALQTLQDAHLVEPAGRGHYRLHEFIGHHTRQVVAVDDTLADRNLAIRRLFEWLSAALQLADRGVIAVRLRLAPLDTHGARHLPSFDSANDAFGWFSRHRDVITSVVKAVADAGWDDRAWRLAESLWPFCYNLKLYDLWYDAYQAGVDAGERIGDPAVIARMRSSLARAYSDHGDFARAADEMRSALDAVSRSGNADLEASVVEFDAIVHFERGDSTGGLERFKASRVMHAELGLDRGVAIQDYYIGKCLIARGAHRQALEPLQHAFDTLVLVEDDVLAGRVLRRRGEAFLGLGAFDEAHDALERSLEISQRLDLRFDQAQTLESMADLADNQQDVEAAHAFRSRAFTIYGELGHPRARAISPIGGSPALDTA